MVLSDRFCEFSRFGLLVDRLLLGLIEVCIEWLCVVDVLVFSVGKNEVCVDCISVWVWWYWVLVIRMFWLVVVICFFSVFSCGLLKIFYYLL